MRVRGVGFVAAVALLLASAGAGARADTDPQAWIVGPNAERTADGHYRVRLADGTELTTHGPDGVENHGTSIGPGDAERPLLCATDYHQHVLYGRPNGSADRLATLRPSILAAMRRMNAVLNEDAMESGALNADYKVKCDGNGEIQIDSFTSSSPSYQTVVDSARATGFTASNADYTIFYDQAVSGVCGIANLALDDRLQASNANNSGGGYAVIYGNCMNNETPMHENAHNQGAVQYGATYSTRAGHCRDENDVMCYNDGGSGGSTFTRCTDRMYFDCGHDTYFDAAPESGEWLATHWNIGSSLNRFIAFRPLERPPQTAFTASCTGRTCTFADISTDETAVVAWSWDFGDSSASAAQSPSHTYAQNGQYLVRLTATDDDGMSSSSYLTLTVPNAGDPDPSTPTLANDRTATGRTAPSGQWRYHKIFVLQGRGALQVSVTAVACTLFVCNPDVDVYVRQGRRPDAQSYACRANGLANTEACSVRLPAGGYWYIGIHTAFATSTPVVDVTAEDYTVVARY